MLSGCRLANCKRPAKNWTTWRGVAHISTRGEIHHPVFSLHCSRIMYGRLPSLRSDGRTETFSSSWKTQRKGCTEKPRQLLFGWVHMWVGGRGLCWVAETGRSPLFFRLVGDVGLGVKSPLSGRTWTWQWGY